MSKYLTLIISSGCNFKCPECPLKEWRRDISDLRNYSYIDLAKLQEFLRDLIDPREWIVEITGGEPTLCKELPPTVDLLTKMGYRISILTNTANLNVLKKQNNIKYFCTWHETQMTFENFLSNVQSCGNECVAVYYPNKKTETDAKVLFERNNIPYVWCAWNEDLEAFMDIMEKLGMRVPSQPYEQITINNFGMVSVCAKTDHYANLYNYSAKNKNDFIPKKKTCTGFPTICPVWFRNEQAWKEEIR